MTAAHAPPHIYLLLMKYVISVFFAVALTACTTTRTQVREGAPTTEQFTDAAQAPLKDLNIVRAKIPQILKDARRAPYAMPIDRSCSALAAEVGSLDEVLGADLDRPPDVDPGLVERGTAIVGNEAVSAVRRTAEDLVPFRSWVRRLTGAERHSREVAAAITAGTVRRAFLKGLGEAAQCPAPAAPRR